MTEEFSIEELANDPSVCGAAQCFYQAERMASLQAQNPTKNQQELVTMAINEWNSSLTLNHKIKYLRIAERMGLAKLYRSYSVSRKPLSLTEMLKREPKKPPKNGYSLFTSEQLAKYVNVEPQKRMTEVARIWRQVISKEEKEQFDSRNKVLLAKYQKDLEDFIEVSVLINQKSKMIIVLFDLFFVF
jgi:transcription factor protein